ncbi:MAG TPA: glucosamine-6-phosphate deaminase [Myxococcota bacterium]|nr:glucosamine-6-phosphate deaminase [Myxococcota bacterium]HQK50651.1 glucosamine-6-phosphate deaminase [Myxococcota bacterium]
MKVIRARDEAEACRFAAHFIVRHVTQNPRSVLGLATGRTMLGLYRDLVDRHRRGEVSFAGCTSFNLDEYVNLNPDHPASYHAYMRWNFVEGVDIPPERVFIPDGNHEPILESCTRYEEEIRKAGGIDLQVLGIGRNGHIAFNEPGSSLASRTRVKRLSQDTILANTPDFGDPDSVPRYVITMGIGTILEARMILLIATGRSKARAVEQMVEGPVTAQCPASVLQMHPHVFVVVDEAAAVRLAGEYDTVQQVLGDPYEEYFWEGA